MSLQRDGWVEDHVHFRGLCTACGAEAYSLGESPNREGCECFAPLRAPTAREATGLAAKWLELRDLPRWLKSGWAPAGV